MTEQVTYVDLTDKRVSDHLRGKNRCISPINSEEVEYTGW